MARLDSGIWAVWICGAGTGDWCLCCAGATAVGARQVAARSARNKWGMVGLGTDRMLLEAQSSTAEAEGTQMPALVPGRIASEKILPGREGTRTRYNSFVPNVEITEVSSTQRRSGLERRKRRLRWFALMSMLVTTAVFFGLHFLHLRADFPNHSPWTDWAKYTDEGWYGDAAIRHYLRGTWRLPGDFNPAAALPVWPLLEAVLFRFTGVGIVAARTLTVAVFGGILMCGYWLLRRDFRGLSLGWSFGKTSSAGLCSAAAVLLMAVSPYFFVFSRMAVLEPLLVLLALMALLVAGRVAEARSGWSAVGLQVAVGVLVALMIGTKTTAVSLVPAVGWMLLSACGWRQRAMLRAVGVAGGTTLAVWGVYFLAVIRPHYLQDFQYLFLANQYTGITGENASEVIRDAFKDGMWIGPVVYPLLFAGLVFACVRRSLWRDPVFMSLALWIAGYFAFLVYHANLQPRYYLVIAVPMVLLVVRAAEHAVLWRWQSALVLVPLLLVMVGMDTRRTLQYVWHPEYSFQTAAKEIERVVESDPSHSHTVLSISGSDLSLMTGLPSICDDFGTMELEDRIAAYKPGWFVAWNYVEDDKMDALGKFYQLTRVAAFPAMDDPDRNVMIVYRLDPKAGMRPKRRRLRKAAVATRRAVPSVLPVPKGA